MLRHRNWQLLWQVDACLCRAKAVLRVRDATLEHACCAESTKRGEEELDGLSHIPAHDRKGSSFVQAPLTDDEPIQAAPDDTEVQSCLAPAVCCHGLHLPVAGTRSPVLHVLGSLDSVDGSRQLAIVGLLQSEEGSDQDTGWRFRRKKQLTRGQRILMANWNALEPKIPTFTAKEERQGETVLVCQRVSWICAAQRGIGARETN